jgi:tetratricopeptide (TPR) repeat protein
MDESVREQMRGAFSSLKQKVDRGRTPPIELSAAYGALGKLLLSGEQLGAAEVCFVNAQTLAPSERRWPYYLGHLYKMKGPLASSVQSFERALELQPEDVATLVWLGEAYLAQGRPGKADAQFAKALALQPELISARFGAGRAALARKDLVRAIEHLERTLALDSRETAAHYPLAMAYRASGDLSKAEAHLRQTGDVQILPPDPLMKELDELLQSPLAYDLRGGRALDAGDLPGAAALFRKGLELAPANASLRLRLGTTLRHM